MGGAIEEEVGVVAEAADIIALAAPLALTTLPAAAATADITVALHDERASEEGRVDDAADDDLSDVEVGVEDVDRSVDDSGGLSAGGGVGVGSGVAVIDKAADASGC